MALNTESKVVSGFACYANVHTPRNKYESERKEFGLELIVDKDTFKTWGKEFSKQKGKSMDNDEFVEKYRIDPPYPEFDEQFIIRLKKAADYEDGNMIKKEYWPKVLIKKGNKAVPLDSNTMVGNGSKVQVSYHVTENKYGTFAKLNNVLVHELVEYQGVQNGSEFGLDIDNGAPEFDTKPTKESKKVESNDDDDEPF